jgi:hypothetical protein
MLHRSNTLIGMQELHNYMRGKISIMKSIALISLAKAGSANFDLMCKILPAAT